MKVLHVLCAVVSVSVPAMSAPASDANTGGLEARVDSGCYPSASPRCCVPTVCQCANGWIYQYNTENQAAGGNGCDPPWAFIGESHGQFPGYCC